jgi:hypothetical protein
MSHSEELRAKVRLAEPGLLEVSEQFWTHPQLADMFPEYLYMMHSIIRSSVSLINSAAEAAEERGAENLLCWKIAKYYRMHAVEETQHDEWLLDDLVSLGWDRAQTLGRLPSPVIGSLVGAQYYWALHVHPVALFGYLGVLEGNPASVEQLDVLRERGGLPEVGMRTMVKHAKLDPHHRDEMFAELDALPLNESQRELIALSAFHAIEHVTQAYEEILETSASSSIRRMAAGA